MASSWGGGAAIGGGHFHWSILRELPVFTELASLVLRNTVVGDSYIQIARYEAADGYHTRHGALHELV